MSNTADNPSDKAYCDYMHFTDNEAYDIALANKADAEREELINPISGTENVKDHKQNIENKLKIFKKDYDIDIIEINFDNCWAGHPRIFVNILLCPNPESEVKSE